MSGQHIGYIRVSMVEQNTGRQLQGITLDRIFEEKVSTPRICQHPFFNTINN